MNQRSSMKLASFSELRIVKSEEFAVFFLCLIQIRTNKIPQTIGCPNINRLQQAISSLILKSCTKRITIKQTLKRSDVMENARNTVHFLVAGSRQSSSMQTRRTREVRKLGRMNVVMNITQSRAYLFVIICQHWLSLQVLLIFITISRKMLRIIDGMYVNTMFLNTKFNILKYLPGASAYMQTSLVMKIIQKFAATLNAILPMMLIVHSRLS